MSDTEAASPAPAAEKSESGFRIVELRIDPDGAFSGHVRVLLSAKIYNRAVAIKYAINEAKQEQGHRLFAVVDPSGKTIAVLQEGTGRPARLTLAMRAKRAIKELLPIAARRRRTSRPASKRTGRGGAPKGRRTSRR